LDEIKKIIKKNLLWEGGYLNEWLRIVKNESTKKLISELNFKELKVLEISGDEWKNFGFKSYQTAMYPEFDICEDVLKEKFDLIIAEQVFEHTKYPYRALKNVYSMLEEGGYFLITTPFLYRYHVIQGEFGDYSRWTEDGMKYFLNEGGFELNNIKTNSWGNKQCVISNLKKMKRPTTYIKSIHSLKNDSNFPIQVWALAKK
jgi:SAM-dependent methyltransferase